MKTVLLDHVDLLRRIVIDEKTKLPFVIDATVVLPDHWHAVWTPPPRDFDGAERRRLVKDRFTKEIFQTGVNIAKDNSFTRP